MLFNGFKCYLGLTEVVASDGIEPSLTGPKAVVLTIIRQGGKAGAGWSAFYRRHHRCMVVLRLGCADFSAIFTNFVVPILKLMNMEFENYLLNQSKGYRECFTAITLSFPMAYIDCFKLSASFRAYSLTSQIILSCGVAILFVLSGAMVHSLCLAIADKEDKQVFLFGILVPTFLPNLLTATGVIHTRSAFIWMAFVATVFMLFSVICLAIHKSRSISNRQRNAEYDADSNDKPV